MQVRSYIDRLKDAMARHWLLLVVAQAIVLVFVGYALRGGGKGGGVEATPASSTSAEAEPTVWTCSMHPQIQQPKPGKCPICGMDLIPVSKHKGGKVTSLRQISFSPDALALMQVEVAPVERKFVTAEINMVGKIDYDETRLGYITAWVPGRLDRLYVDFTGVEVKKGEHMVEMYSPELYEAQEELILAVQAVKQRQGTFVDDARRLLESAREKLRLWGMTPEQISQIEQQQRPTDHMTIYAPMGGIVIEKKRQEGDYVNTGERIYTVADLSWVWVRLDAYESDLPWLHYGQKVTFTTEAYPGEPFEGRIVFIDPVLNARTRTVKVRVNVPNEDGRLKPEMFVHARVRALVATEGRVMDPELAGKWIGPMHPEIIRDGPGTCPICGMPLVPAESLGYVPAKADASDRPLVIPVSAALVTGKRAIVYVQLPDTEVPTFEGREIVLGPRAGDYYLVRAGLREGELVATRGNFKIDSALQIQAKPSMMTPEGGGGGGHHHGGGSSAAQKGEATQSAGGMKVPAKMREQLEGLELAFKTVGDAIQVGDLDQIRAAFHAFEADLRAISADALSGHAAMMWDELAMLLRNDAIEGGDVQRLKEAYRVFNEMANHMRRLRQQFLQTPVASAKHDHGPVEKFDAPEQFRLQLSNVWLAYARLSDALAADDLEQARKHVSEMTAALEKIDMKLLQGEAHQAWMHLLGEMKPILQRMKTAPDIDALREAFSPLSDVMANAIRMFGIDPALTVYQLHCPMALGDRGADWLQADRDVRNPYFGSKMLRCVDGIRQIAGERSGDKKEAGHEHP